MSSRYPTTPMCDGALLELFEDRVRDSDVFVTTTAKCGQTWLQTLLYHLKTRGQCPDFEGKGLMGVSPWLELPWNARMRMGKLASREDFLAELEDVQDPRVFKMHVVWDEVPRKPGSAARVITITRDPREVPYSMYQHMVGLGAEDGDDFDTFFDRWLERGLYFELVASYWKHHDDPDFLWLRFEDMKRDLRGHAERLIEFLGWEVSSEDIERVLPMVDIAHMQEIEDSDLFGKAKSIWQEGHRFIREGAVGKNRARLSSEQEARILDRARRDFPPECLSYVLSLPE